MGKLLTAEDDYITRASQVLTSVKVINKADAMNLLSHFGSIANIFQASVEQLLDCPGLGDKKVTRLHAALNTCPFGAVQ